MIRTVVGVVLGVMLCAGCGGDEASNEIVAGPDERQTVDLGTAPSRGADDAKVVIVEFADFECPYCAGEEEVLLRVLADFAGDVRFVYKQFPLPYHLHAQLAAEAALAAQAQGQFWAYHDALYANPEALTRPDLEAYAVELGLDLDVFRAALDEGTYAVAVDADVQQGTSLDIPGTPTFFINGRMGAGALSYKTFAAVIKEELQLAGN